MKKLYVIVFIAFAFSLGVNSQSAEDITNAENFTFFGIDYTYCYFVPSEAFYDTDDLGAKIVAWNNLFKSEHEKYLGKNFSKEIVFNDEMVRKLNVVIDPVARVSDDESLFNHINKEAVNEIVSNYQITEGLSGIGFILIAECYSKTEVLGAYYVVFFDIPTKEILTVDRMEGKARGFGLRNYWANSYHVVLKDVGDKIK